MTNQHLETLIIGAGHAGLATGCHPDERACCGLRLHISR